MIRINPSIVVCVVESDVERFRDNFIIVFHTPYTQKKRKNIVKYLQIQMMNCCPQSPNHCCYHHVMRPNRECMHDKFRAFHVPLIERYFDKEGIRLVSIARLLFELNIRNQFILQKFFFSQATHSSKPRQNYT